MQLCFMTILIQLLECVNLSTTLGKCKEALYSYVISRDLFSETVALNGGQWTSIATLL